MGAFKCEPTDYKSFFWYYSVVANMTYNVADDTLLAMQKEAYQRWHHSKLPKYGDI